jgi:hypothetical protein
LELGEEFSIGCAENVMNFVHLIKFVVAWEQREEGKYFEVNAADTPVVHLVVVVSVSQKALWRAVPSCADVFCEGWL